MTGNYWQYAFLTVTLTLTLTPTLTLGVTLTLVLATPFCGTSYIFMCWTVCLFFPLTIDVLGQNYVLKGMVRCISPHFTVAIKYDILWVYIDDMCSSVRNYSSCQDLWHSHPKGWFFAIFEKSLISINNDIQAHLRTSETSQQNSVGTSQVNLCTVDTCSTKPLTASEISALAFYAICFSVLKPCSYWNSDTLDAIVQFGNTFFIKTIKSQWSWALPENINILGANVNVNFVGSSNGTLVSTSSSSKLCLERFILNYV